MKNEPNSKSRNVSVLLPNGKLNLPLIHRDVQKDVQSELLYQAEDDMKKRAVHMSKNYDEFRNFVACASLRPVQKHEMNQLLSHGKGDGELQKNPCILNKAYSSSSSMERDPTLVKIMKECNINRSQWGQEDVSLMRNQNSYPPSSLKENNCHTTNTAKPKNLMEFEKEWRYFCRNVNNTLHYLLCFSEESPYGMDMTHHPLTSFLDRFLVISTSKNGSNRTFRLNPQLICCTFCKIEMNSDVFEGILEALFSLVQFLQELSKDHFYNNDDTNQKGEERYLNSSSQGPKEDRTNEVNVARHILYCFMYQWMKYLTSSGGFELNISFLASQQREHVIDIIEYLEKNSVTLLLSPSTTGLNNAIQIDDFSSFCHLIPTQENVKDLRQNYHLLCKRKT